MDHAALVRVSEAGADLLEIEERLFHRQGTVSRQRRHVATGQVFEDQVMKGGTVKVDSGAMSQAVDHVWVSHTIKRHRFILEIGNQGALEVGIRSVLEKQVKGFNYNRSRGAFGGGIVICDVDFGITAATEAFKNV